jgi:hypothetical protein
MSQAALASKKNRPATNRAARISDFQHPGGNRDNEDILRDERYTRQFPQSQL